MMNRELVPELMPGILTTIHCEDRFGKEDFEIDFVKEIYEKTGTKTLILRLDEKYGMIEHNISDEGDIVSSEYDHDVRSICSKVGGLLSSRPYVAVLIDCLDELHIDGFTGTRDDEVEEIREILRKLAQMRNISVTLTTNHMEEDGDYYPELDSENGPYLEQLKG